jgi:hypothetical protein
MIIRVTRASADGAKANAPAAAKPHTAARRSNLSLLFDMF